MAETESSETFKLVCEAVRKGKAVLWVGAGFSKYAGYPLGSEFASELAQAIKYQAGGNSGNLPVVAEQYCVKKGRGALKEKVKIVFGKEPKSLKTHQSLALIRYNIPYIVTTNYDRLFEKAYDNDLIPVVREEEVPTISNQGVGLHKPILYKPHGDVEHLDQLVITRRDYSRFDRESFLWRRLCTLPTEFSMIFIGYSMEDENARELLDIVFSRLGSQTNPHFIINREVTDEDRARYKDSNVNWIAKDAGKAVTELVDYVARYSFIDSHHDSARMEAYKDLWRDRNVRFDTAITANKRVMSPRPVDPSLPFVIKGTLHIKADKDAPELKDFDDVNHRRKCDSVELCGPTCQVKMDAEVNGILLFDPDNPDFDSVKLHPKADEEIEVDLQLGDGSMRLPNAQMQRHFSSTNPRLVIESQWLTITIDLDTGVQGGSFTLKIHDVGDIEKGREIYTFLERWLNGASIQVISANPNNFWEIPSMGPTEEPDGWDKIHFWYRCFTDLSEIQTKLRMRLPLPEDRITYDDAQNIAGAANLLRGFRKSTGGRSITVGTEGSDIEKVLITEPVLFRFTNPDFIETFEIFGIRVPVPFYIEARGVVLSNVEEARAALERGDKRITLQYDESIGEILQRYPPPKPSEDGEEMTSP